jgi:uncharacterized hydrophobic protein (TIGR00271 family)
MLINSTKKHAMTASNKTAPFTQLGFNPDYLPAFEEKLFIEGPLSARRLTNFFALLLMATFIATYGVLSGSTATVIGAMIVAPLMGPIMATTAAVVMGAYERAMRAMALVLIGVVTVIVASFLLSFVAPDVTVSFTSNSEITSRINPGLYALLTALGSGVAGAFITSRAELADSIGGVAIAISLVPPLCVVGIAVQQNQLNAALGALLLFTTNFTAILLAGGITFWVVGLRRLAMTDAQRKIRRAGLALFLMGILIVAIPLSLNTYQVIVVAAENQRASSAVTTWLAGSNYQIVGVKVNNRDVNVTVEGTGELKPAQALANQVAQSLGRSVVITLRAVPIQRSNSDGN